MFSSRFFRACSCAVTEMLQYPGSKHYGVKPGLALKVIRRWTYLGCSVLIDHFKLIIRGSADRGRLSLAVFPCLNAGLGCRCGRGRQRLVTGDHVEQFFVDAALAHAVKIAVQGL